MKNLIIYILILFPNICFSSGEIHFELIGDTVIQGSLIKTKFKFQQTLGDGFQIGNLEGVTLDDTVYINELLPVNGDPDGNIINGEASIIFIKVPVKSNIEHKMGSFQINASWTEIEFIPTDTPKELLFGEFNVPDSKRLILWVLLGAGILVFFGVILIFWKKWKKLKFKKIKKINLKNSLLSPNSYDEVVQIWEMKHDILKVFPFLEDEFKKLEKVLFKYQFKPKRTNSEEDEVLVEYRKFIDSIKGGFDGI